MLNLKQNNGLDVRRVNEQSLFCTGSYNYQLNIQTQWWNYFNSENIKTYDIKSKFYNPKIW